MMRNYSSTYIPLAAAVRRRLRVVLLHVATVDKPRLLPGLASLVPGVKCA